MTRGRIKTNKKLDAYRGRIVVMWPDSRPSVLQRDADRWVDVTGRSYTLDVPFHRIYRVSREGGDQ